ncbi:MAG TPA: isoprenylcysteine carboxylmethyltransferase family protein [Chloroflexi bacterium]|nr:isoprenylcysteine carboxylmethyltransferase family protein [Chloroflexota bacterium]
MISDNIFETLFLFLLVTTELIRLPYYVQSIYQHRKHQIIRSEADLWDRLFFLFVVIGTWGAAMFKIKTSWFSFADFNTLSIVNVLGIFIYLAGLILLVHSHRQLKRNWSPTIEINQQQELVTSGIYRWIRHPIYAAVWLMVIAQVLLINNLILGLTGVLSFSLLYNHRVTREEQMMAAHFGKEFAIYCETTGRLLPDLLSNQAQQARNEPE